MIPIQMKAGVNLSGFSVQMVLAVQVAQSIYYKHAAPALVITSANDSRHSHKSLHYAGQAVDLRTRNFPSGSTGREAQSAAADIKEALGRDFDVVLEDDHIHIEYDPRRPTILQ